MKKILPLLMILVVLIFTASSYVIETNHSDYNIKNNLTVQVSATTSDYIEYRDIPQDLIYAVISVEDHRFFTHRGFDILGFSRALYTNIKTRSLEQGGSTITQQLAKNLFLTQDKTFDRKIKELFLARKLERIYSKEEILEMYLNNSYFGAGAYGIQEASNVFFHKDATELSVEECAMLAGVLKGPSIYNPQEHLQQAQNRQALVLKLMKERGYIQ